MKTIGYITGVHPHLANRTHTKECLFNTLNMTFIPYDEASKLNSSMKEASSMQETDEDPTVHCPIFELFQTTIGIGSKPHVKTDVIGIKCQSSQVALLQEFLINPTKNLSNKAKESLFQQD